MLPKNQLRWSRLKRLRVFLDESHPYERNVTQHYDNGTTVKVAPPPMSPALAAKQLPLGEAIPLNASGRPFTQRPYGMPADTRGTQRRGVRDSRWPIALTAAALPLSDRLRPSLSTCRTHCTIVSRHGRACARDLLWQLLPRLQLAPSIAWTSLARSIARHID